MHYEINNKYVAMFLKVGFWLQGEVGEKKGSQHFNNEEKQAYTRSRSLTLRATLSRMRDCCVPCCRSQMTTPSLNVACRLQASEISRLGESRPQPSISVWRAKATDLACPIWLWPWALWLAHLSSGLNSHGACGKSWLNSSSITRLGDPCRAQGWPGGSSS